MQGFTSGSPLLGSQPALPRPAGENERWHTPPSPLSPGRAIRHPPVSRPTRVRVGAAEWVKPVRR